MNESTPGSQISTEVSSIHHVPQETITSFLLCHSIHSTALPFGWEEAYTTDGVRYYIK